MEFNENVQSVHLFWQYISEKSWNKARQLLADDFEATWPQSREKMSAEGFIEVNKNYPGTHKIQVENSNNEYDKWDHRSHVTTQTHVESQMPDGKKLEFYALSFFEVEDTKIVSLVEYWAETYPAPEWRNQWVKKY